MPNNDCDISFDDDFVRDNLSFLLDEEFSGPNSLQGNESSIYKDVTAKLECSINTAWSSSSSGSICSVKEEATEYVNVCLSYDEPKPSLSLESRFSFDFNIGETSSQADKNSFSMDFPNHFTSTPKRKAKPVPNELPSEENNSSMIWSDSSMLAEPVDKLNAAMETESFCNFCRKNGEPEHVYSSHTTKMEDGTVTCPILKKYVCELCCATGENAHTRKYCPFYKRKFQPKTSMRRLSNGVVVSCFNHK